MKKLFAVIALVALMTSCKSKKKEEKKMDDTTVNSDTTSKMDNTTNNTDNTATTGVPSFSDPEVQKFANDYYAFVQSYKAGMKDPAKLMELSKNMQDWGTRATAVGTKIATNPGEAKKWTDFVMAMNKEMMPQQ